MHDLAKCNHGEFRRGDRRAFHRGNRAWISLVGSTVVDNRCDIATHTDLLTLGRVVRGHRVQTRKGQRLWLKAPVVTT